MPNRDAEVFFVIRLPNGQFLDRVQSNGLSSSVKHPVQALRFSILEEAEGYVSQYLRRDASCLGITKVTVETEIVRESCIG